MFFCPNNSFKAAVNKRSLRSSRKLFSIGALLMLFALSFTPLIAAEMSASQKKVHARYAAIYPFYSNQVVNDYVSEVGERVLASSDHSGRSYHFFVLDIAQLDAFTPGYGLIYISRGMLIRFNTEGELAGVLAHEIGHNVGRHISRSKTKRYLGNALAWTAAIFTGSTSVGEAVGLSSQLSQSGFGRELELEADQYAAEYLYRADYDPAQMFGVLEVLKSDENFSRVRGGGVQRGSLFSSHPRTDKRLTEVIESAGQLPPGEGFVGRDELRHTLEGMVVGPSYRGNISDDELRYTNATLGITFVYPKAWSKTIKGANIILKDPDKTIQLKISTEKTVDRTKSSAELLKLKYPKGLDNVLPVNPQSQRDLGVLAGHEASKRVALVTVARNSFHFVGVAKNNRLTAVQDAAFVKIIRSFRRPGKGDTPPESVPVIVYERLEPGDTFASIASRYKQKDSGLEGDLRIINGYWPKGEPEPGTWLKVLKYKKYEQHKQSEHSSDVE